MCWWRRGIEGGRIEIGQSFATLGFKVRPIANLRRHRRESTKKAGFWAVKLRQEIGFSGLAAILPRKWLIF
jgi:hypothetical protein